MTAPIRPRQLVHRGTVEASAAIIDPALIGETAARARILALWEPGCSLRRIDGRYLFRFRSPSVLSTHTAPGLLLVPDGALASSAPLLPNERQGLTTPAHSVVTVLAGDLQPLATGEPVDPSEWIDVSDFRTVEVEALAAPPPPVAALITPTEPDARRALLPSLGAPPPEATEVMAQLAAMPGRDGRRLKASVETAAYRVGGLLGRFLAVPLVRALDAVFPRPQTQSTGSTDPAGRAPMTTGEATPSSLQRLLTRLQRWSSMALARSQLGRIFAHRHAQYLAQLLDMFEQGRLDEALRHAIPLGGKADEAPRPALGLPAPRPNLAISTGQRTEGSAYYWGINVHAELRRRYRLAVEQLTRAGRIEEAAFVLVELLQANEEAVALLEKHDKLRLAAEIAESRNLPADLVIRQWFLAGEAERALAIARRTGAFAGAVWRLHRTHPDRALAFRLHWADHLAQGGNYAAAVDVLWGVPDANRLVERFVELAIGQGGTSGARILPRKLVVTPGAFESVRDRALEILGRQDEPGPLLAFAESLRDILSGRTLKLTPKDGAGIRVWSSTGGGTNLPPVSASPVQGAIDIDATSRDSGIRRQELIRALEKATHQAALKAVGRSRPLEASYSETKRVVELFLRVSVTRDLKQIAERRFQIYYRDADREEFQRQDERWPHLGLTTAPQGLGRIEIEAAERLQQYVFEHRRSVVGEAMRVLARPTVRSLLRLSHRDPQAFALAKDLAAVADDGALRADLPAAPRVVAQPLNTRDPPLAIDVDARDVGQTPVFDAALLPDGRVVVALGELGARLLTADGRTVAHFDCPTHALVVSDHGDRAIAITLRGDAKVLSIMDLTARTARSWTEVRINAWARTYDGATWFTANHTRFQAIDALSPDLRSVWSVDTQNRCQWVDRGGGDDRLAIGVRPEVWWYETASMTLRERREIEPPHSLLNTASADGAVLAHVPAPSGYEVALITGRSVQPLRGFESAEGFVATPRLCVSRGWIAMLLIREDSTVAVELLSRDDSPATVSAPSTPLLRAKIQLGKAGNSDLRLGRDAVTVCDHLGRVLVLSLDDGRLLRSIRV